MSRFKLIPEVHLVLFKEGKILLSQRQNTGYEDGNYSLVAGHLEGDETVTSAMSRETMEEANLDIPTNHLELAHIMHRKDKDERMSFFFTARVFQGKPTNMEPDKCSDLSWFTVNSMPSNTIPYVKSAIESIISGEIYSEFGWN